MLRVRVGFTVTHAQQCVLTIELLHRFRLTRNGHSRFDLRFDPHNLFLQRLRRPLLSVWGISKTLALTIRLETGPIKGEDFQSGVAPSGDEDAYYSQEGKDAFEHERRILT